MLLFSIHLSVLDFVCLVFNIQLCFIYLKMKPLVESRVLMQEVEFAAGVVCVHGINTDSI